jgi:predicted amidohydrolase YtcJ
MTTHLRDVEVDGLRTNVTVGSESIIAVGPAVRPVPGDIEIDGRGGALVPGLHDHHIHLAALAAAMSSIAAGPPTVRDRRDLATALGSAAATAPPGTWLRAVGYHERVAGELDRWALDRLVAHRPLRVQHRSGALWIVNSDALGRLGLLEGSVPDGCEVLTDGTPTGRLWRLDRWLAEQLGTPAPNFRAVGRSLLTLGVTGVTDMTPYDDAEDFVAIGDAAATGDLPQRVTVTGSPHLDITGLPRSLEVGPAKLLLADHDLPTLDELTSLMRKARRANRTIAVHCVTRVSLVLTLTAFDDVGTVAGDRIEHGAVIPRQLDVRLRTIGLTVVTQPNFVAERGDDYLTSVDAEDMDELWRCQSLLDDGVLVGAGTDAPFGEPDPWALIAAAVDRRTTAGEVLHAAERVTPARALALLLGRPGSPGGPIRRVAVGEPADLCLLAAPLRDALASRGCNPVRAVVRRGHLAHGE